MYQFVSIEKFLVAVGTLSLKLGCKAHIETYIITSFKLKLCQCLIVPQRRQVYLNYSGV